jgi:hypothetical protein
MRNSLILVGFWITIFFAAGNSIAQESSALRLEPVPLPRIAGAVRPVLANGAVSQLISDGLSPKKAEAVLSLIPLLNAEHAAYMMSTASS